MPTAPLRPCSVPQCPEFAGPQGRCLRHAQEREQHRGTARARGYSRKWEALAERFRAKYPLCGMRPGGKPPVMSQCHAEGRITMVEQVDHVVPHRGNQELMWDEDNLQSLCIRCHARKTRAGL